MKNRISIILTVLMIGCLCACGKKTSDTPAEQETSNASASSQNIDNAETDIPEEIIDESPRTAAEPPALLRDELPNPVGSPDVTLWGEEDCEMIFDQGEDGRTLTKNGFDNDGSLVWWEAYEYDDRELAVKGTTRDPDGTILRWEEIVYDDTGMKTGSKSYRSDDSPAAEYEYSENGSISSICLYDDAGNRQRLVNYDEEGAEKYVAEYDENGELLREYEDGYLKIDFPDTTEGILTLLNETADEDFEETYASCKNHMEKEGMTESWDSLCRTLSATLDYIDSPMQTLRERFHLIESIDSSGFYNIRELIDNGLNPKLKEAVYQENCRLTYGWATWIPDLFEEALPETAPDYEEGAPVRIVYVDSSSIIGVPGPGFMDMTHENLEDEQVSDEVREHMNLIFKGIFYDYNNVLLTGDPAMADIIVEVNTTYNYTGTYSYEDGSLADVYGTYINVTATDRHSDQTASVQFVNVPGESLYASGSTVWMRIPDFDEDPYRSDADAFAQTILSWYNLQ